MCQGYKRRSNMNCSECKYSYERERNNYSPYGMSADCNLTCYYDTKTETYVNSGMVCDHFSNQGGINWNERRKREYPIRKV